MNNLINKFSVLFFIFNCFNSMAQSSFWIEGQIRPRIEFRNGFKTLQSDSSSAMAFIEQRSRLALGYDNKFISMYVALQDVRVWGSTPLVNKVSGNFSLFQAWAKVKINPYTNIKIGRQVFSFDNQRILGGLNWAPQGRAHDALSFEYKNDSLDMELQLGGAYNVSAPSLNEQPYAVSGNYRTMQFLRFYKKFKPLNFSIIALNVGREYQDRINFELTAGALINLTLNNFTARFEGYYQYGKNSSDLITNAYLFAAKFAYKLKPEQFTIGADLLSGTDFDNANDLNNSFNPWLGTNHIFYGNLDYFYVGNSHSNIGLLDVYGSVSFKTLKNKIKMSLTYHYFHAPGQIKDSNNIPVNGQLGHEVDFVFKYQIKKYFGVYLGYGQMFGLPDLEIIKPSGNVNNINNWAWLTLNVNLELFRHNIKKKIKHL